MAKNMKQKFSTNLAPLNATYASVRLFSEFKHQ